MDAHGFFPLIGGQRFESAGDAPQKKSLFFFRRHRDDNVRGDPLFVDHLVAGRVVFRCGQAQCGAVSHRQNLLHRTFAKGLFAKNDRPRNARRRRVLQAAGDDFRSAGAAVVDQDHERQIGMRAAP